MIWLFLSETATCNLVTEDIVLMHLYPLYQFVSKCLINTGIDPVGVTGLNPHKIDLDLNDLERYWPWP